MFKHLLILCGSVALLALFLWFAFGIRFSDAITQPTIVVNIEADLAQFEAELTKQEALYQTELEALTQTLQEQQRDQKVRRQTLNSQITAAQAQLAELQQKKQGLQAELAQLAATQAEQQTAHQIQLQQLHDQYEPELNQLQSRLTEARTKLAQLQP